MHEILAKSASTTLSSGSRAEHASSATLPGEPAGPGFCALDGPDGVRIPRRFTREGVDPLDEVVWETRDAVIRGADGGVVFEQRGVSFPRAWSQAATDVVTQKYFRGRPGTPERESSARSMICRVAETIRAHGQRAGYLRTEASARAFRDELVYLLLHQRVAFNSPVWFNVGVDERPQCSACFINSVADSMDSIMALAQTEATLFKYGSGAGSNLSAVRSSREQLSGGGSASGPVAFMRGFDAFAGAIKSGGKTRRAAKMVILDAGHPDILEFVECKVSEERKAAVLVDAGYDGGFDVPGGAYDSVDHQNANHSVRVPDAFMQAVVDDRSWQTRAVTDGRVIEEYSARYLMRRIAAAAWACGDPGIQFDTTINRWHTCPAAGRISASNPCQPADATILTPDGIRTIGDVDVGSSIWSGRRWTRITRKVATGTKPVAWYHTRAGSFLGTAEHRVICRGERVEVQYARAVDLARGPIPDLASVREVDVLDGLLVGRGVTRPVDGHLCVLLDVGPDGQGLLGPGVSALVNPGAIYGYHRVRGATIQPDELFPVHRQVPDRFFYGDVTCVRGFLRGLYSARGAVVDSVVQLKGSALQLSQVQQMLSSLGICAHHARCQDGDGYGLEVGDVEVFRDLVGFVQPDKTVQLEEACGERHGRNWSKTSYEVTEVELLPQSVPVFDLTVEDEEHTYWTGGLLVSNCSEYMFLDDTACNLASLNLRKFQRADGDVDADDLRHAVGVTILAMEILVDLAGYPTARIAQMSRRFRTLGLGYANLGALLMSRGLPYDSDAARAYAGAVTALVAGEAYRASALLARDVGPFEAFGESKDAFLAVVRGHRDALAGVDPAHAPAGLLAAARQAWDGALELGARHGLRNAQGSVLAPTGTIAFLMDCDTTGVEPDVALVKSKRLVGGGSLRIVNRTVPEALVVLGYAPEESARVLAYVEEHGTVEGCPELRGEHLAVFDCALAPAGGSRSIHYLGHLRMMAAVQPFLSGAISKTVNLPASSTIADVEDVYLEAWRMGLKSIAVYRDGCKRTQPLSTAGSSRSPEVLARPVVASPGAAPALVSDVLALLTVEERRAVEEVRARRTQADGPPVACRYKLPTERPSRTHKFSVSGHEGYVTVGLYRDGSPGEIFVRMAKEGSTVSGLMDSFATVASIALQHGVPLRLLAEKFKDTRFEPAGFTGNQEIPIATSIMDYLFRWLALRFPRAAGTEERGAPDRGPVVQDAGAPTCHTCGMLMVRSGACHRCTNCGSTSGCS